MYIPIYINYAHTTVNTYYISIHICVLEISNLALFPIVRQAAKKISEQALTSSSSSKST